eukprot:TRINITY_DN19261_c0_g1_i2.p1 TRINITY_DN19261_c0_g1~~TRINITY_DN19261_c0_g1_i2.p1  ORF type:complete len:698 (-),score=75.30 TRINITY_DN19261_c0_g1_i2:211-2304(-)
MMALRFCSIIMALTTADGLNFIHTWHGAPVMRSYNLHTPSASCGLQGMAVVLDPGGSGECSEFSSWVDSMCILVVCPQKASSRSAWLAMGTDGDSEDVEFIAALIQSLRATYRSPANKVIVTGFSLGGSMSYRLWCERADVVTGIVAIGQSFVEPAAGHVGQGGCGSDCTDTALQMGATARSNGNGCAAQPNRPHYAVVGTLDENYGESSGAYRGKALWERMSTTVLGCAGSPTGSDGASITVDASTCYEYPSCAGLSASLNKYCSVPGRGHSTEHWQMSVRTAFANFFSGAPSPSPTPTSSPAHLPRNIYEFKDQFDMDNSSLRRIHQFNVDDADGPNEVGFIHSLVDKIVRSYALPRNSPKIALGFSAGAGLSSLLGCHQKPRLYPAHVAVHYNRSSDWPSTCRQEASPCAEWNGVGADDSLFLGGIGGADGIQKQFGSLHMRFKCPAENVTMTQGGKQDSESDPAWTCYEYPHCSMLGQLCIYDKVGHWTWPSLAKHAWDYLTGPSGSAGCSAAGMLNSSLMDNNSSRDAAGNMSASGWNLNQRFMYENLTRSYHVYVPRKVQDADAPTGLMLFFHGAGLAESEFQQLPQWPASLGWGVEEAAEHYGFIGVVPLGVASTMPTGSSAMKPSPAASPKPPGTPSNPMKACVPFVAQVESRAKGCTECVSWPCQWIPCSKDIHAVCDSEHAELDSSE